MRGIYKIYCEQEDCVYIGSSIDVEKRWGAHKKDLRKGNHRNKNLQLAWDAYGEDSFSFSIEKEVSDTKDLLQWEQKVLDCYTKYYNEAKIVSNPMHNKHIVQKQVESLRKSGNRAGQKLSVEQVVLIKEALRDEIHTSAELADMYDVTFSCIHGIKTEKNWDYVEVEGFEKTIDNKNHQILTEEHVREIKTALRDKTHTQTELAKLFEVSTSTIQAIAIGRNWAYVQVEGFTEGRKPKTTDFLPEIVELKQAGLTHNQIIEALGLSCRSNGITYALKRAKKLGIA